MPKPKKKESEELGDFDTKEEELDKELDDGFLDDEGESGISGIGFEGTGLDFSEGNIADSI